MKHLIIAFILFISSQFTYAQNYVEATSNGTLKANSFTYISPKNNYYTLDESSFVNMGSGNIFRGRLNGTGGVFYYDGGTGPGIATGMIAPVNLPNNCTVKNITIHFDDTSINYNLEVKFSKHSLITGAYTDYGTAVSSGNSGYGKVSSEPINHIIDNKENSYQIFVRCIDLANSNAIWQGYFTVLRGVVIEYTTAETN